MQISRPQLHAAFVLEQQRFVRTNPRSATLFERAKPHMLAGVPMHWMVRWPGAFPIHAATAEGAELVDADGHRLIDFCLGDTAAMAGHAPAAVAEAVDARMRTGSVFMLPTEDAQHVSAALAANFGLPSWQYALTATDANRFVLRIARALTGRAKILVFNYCYHGSVDETLATLHDGVVGARSGNLGPQVAPAHTTRVVEFNDLDALRRELAHGDVACVLAEPAMTNIGIIHPDPGYWPAAQAIIREAGALLIIDETHTLCMGPGGCTQAWGLQPDMLTVGKAIGGGVPVAAYGFSADIVQRLQGRIARDSSDTGGIGGTLAGNALSMNATRATLAHVLTPPAFAHMRALATRWADGVQSVIDALALPWHVSVLGGRAEYWYHPFGMRNGGQAAASYDGEIDAYLHLAALNRGILMTPFHNMALMCPATTQAHVDVHTAVFADIVRAVVA